MMFNDHRNTNRDTWRFEYLGKELIAAAEHKITRFATMETSARTDVSALLQDPNVRAKDPRIEQLRANIESYSEQKEKCMIWRHEFKRNPEKTFSLLLGDVSFFNLAGTGEDSASFDDQ